MPRTRVCLLPAFLVFPLLLVIPIHSRPNSTELYLEAKKIALSGDIDGAIPAFIKVVEVNPYYALGHYGLGKAYLYKEGKLKEAVFHLKKAVECDRKLARGHFYLGLALMFSRRYEQANHAFLAAYENDSGIYEAFYNLAVIHDIMGISFKANKYYEKYVYEKNKRDSEILF